MISAASVLVLLFLPSEKGAPLARPRGAAPQFAPVTDPAWELWPRRPRLGAKPLVPSERSPHSSRRKDGRPNSLDLTFHLLREFLEMSREERLAQKALSNKMLLRNIGK
uniref:Corticotropin-releasing factor domain-containing protein n=1 Tax=Gopherus agassizii TaxID=38772 RepID=A0A452H8R6_9SAUR